MPVNDVTDTPRAAPDNDRFPDTTRSGQDDPASVQIIFLEDPDGTRVELMRLAEGQEW